MIVDLLPDQRGILEKALERSGLRATRQREHVFAVLLSERDHPTADEVYARARESMPSISLATVYNCLETFADCGLVNKLSFEREPARFCPKDEGEHAHFLDEETGRIFDVPLPGSVVEQLKALLPDEFEPRRVKLSYTGRRASETVNGSKSASANGTTSANSNGSAPASAKSFHAS